MARASSDYLFDARYRGRGDSPDMGGTLCMMLRELVDEVGDGLCDRAPIRHGRVARRADRLLHRAQACPLAQLRQAGTTQKQTEHRVGDGGLVETAQVLIAAAGPSQQRIAHLEEGRADALARRTQFTSGGNAMIYLEYCD